MYFKLFLTRIGKLVKVIQYPRLLRSLVCDRVLAAVEHRKVLRPQLATVVDVGANRGQFSLAVCIWAPDAKVFAFEPLKEPAARFRKVFKGNSKVNFHHVAIGPKAGKMTIHVSASDDCSSLLPISGLQEKLFPGTGEVRTETVKVGRLVEFISENEIVEPALLKLDVQGFELETLRGCEELLHWFSYVYVECSFVELYTGQALAHEIIDWLWRRGFQLSGIYNVIYDKLFQALQGDFIFLNKSGHNKKTVQRIEKQIK